MDNKKYNGWSNYATWRVNLEMIDGWPDYHMEEEGFETFESYYKLGEHLKDYCESQIDNYLERGTGMNLARDYALAFMSDVNWLEIAEHMAEDYPKILSTYDEAMENGEGNTN